MSGNISLIPKSEAVMLQEETNKRIETLEQKLERIEQDNLILMDALATVYEELLTLKDGGAV